jgi:XTP/dITP diphosphohydrolase
LSAARLTVVCASANPDKVAEIEAILGDVLVLLPRPADVPDVTEDADSLSGNARLKATALAAATHLPSLADDTGLEVDALHGRPGVRSGRYAGDQATYQENVTLLLRELSGVAPEERTARFRTVAMVRWSDRREVIGEGVCDGTIATSPRGSRGFGYDSVFVPASGDGRTFAEMSSAEKHELSHRGRALRSLLDALQG